MSGESYAEPDVPAQITIALVEFVQTALAVAARSYWRVLPNPLPLRRTDVVTTLAALPKPVRVAPLAQPGALGTWPYEPATELERTLFEQRARKIRERVREILEPYTAGSQTVPVLLAHEATEWLVPSTGVLEWSRDYVLDGVGWILADSGGDPRAPVRFILSRPDGTWYPAVPHHPLGSEVLAVLEEAEAEAVRYQQEVAGTEHVLLALTRSPDPAMERLWSEAGVSYEKCDRAVSRLARRGPAGMKPRAGARSSRLRNALESAARISREQASAEVENRHLLEALVSDTGPATLTAEVLRACDQSPESVAGALVYLRNGA